MTLYLETPSGFVVWTGQPIGEGDDAVCHPLHIEQLWSAGALADWGLYVPAEADPVPEGKVITATTVERVGEVVQFVHVLADAPVYVPSTPRIFAMGRFSVAEWEISAISATMGIAGATLMDTGVYWIDFAEPQPNTDYIAIASDREKSVTVTERYESFCVVECTDLAGLPANPSEFVIQLTKVI